MGFIAFLTSPMAKYLIFAAIIAGIVFSIYRAGENHIQDKWDEANIKVEKQIEELKAKAAQVTIKTEIQYVDRVKTVQLKGDTVTTQVPIYITKEVDAKCVIPNNFLLLHDSAAMNIIPKGVK